MLRYHNIACRLWPRAVWIEGEGRYALLARCRDLSISLWPSREAAQKAMTEIEGCCGGACVDDHEIVDLGRLALGVLTEERKRQTAAKKLATAKARKPNASTTPMTCAALPAPNIPVKTYDNGQADNLIAAHGMQDSLRIAAGNVITFMKNHGKGGNGECVIVTTARTMEVFLDRFSVALAKHATVHPLDLEHDFDCLLRYRDAIAAYLADGTPPPAWEAPIHHCVFYQPDGTLDRQILVMGHGDPRECTVMTAVRP